ncbi:MAG TPA: hypothetical protein VGM90_37210 [Kofleriaceae bacterium]
MALQEKFDRLAAIRGDTNKGLPESAWKTNLDDQDRDQLLRAAIDATRKLVLPEWESKRVDDRRPQDALAAAEAWLANKTSADVLSVAKEAAKACTAARNETFGGDHRIPEAARACAWSCGAKDNEHIWEAFSAIEGDLLARVHLTADYQKIPEQRRNLLAAIRRVLEPPPAEAPKPTGPQAYSASGSFAVGDKLTHVKFGNLEVVTVVGTAIEVKLDDGSIKKLVHKPK